MFRKLWTFKLLLRRDFLHSFGFAWYSGAAGEHVLHAPSLALQRLTRGCWRRVLLLH